MDFLDEARGIVAALDLQLTPVPHAKVDALARKFPGLPATYRAFLMQIGSGSFQGKFRLYSGLVDPGSVYDADTAEELRGILLVGDDYQGVCVGFVPDESWRVVEVDPTLGEADPIADTFEAFMRSRLESLQPTQRQPDHG